MIDTNSTLGSGITPVATAGWFEPAVAALTIAGIILVIVYGISRVLNDEKMKAWAISEAGQFVASGLIIGSLAAIITFLASVATAVTGEPNIFGFAFKYLVSLQVKATELSGLILALSMVVGVLKSISIQLVVGVTPLAGLDGIFKVLNDMLGMTFLISLILEVQKSLLLFIQTTMLQLFLPIGVILRTLPFTRAVGGFLMALAIGLAVVFPLTFALDQQALNTQSTLLTEDIKNQTETLRQNADITKFDTSNPEQMLEFAKNQEKYNDYNDWISHIDAFRVAVAELLVAVLFLPLVNLIITLLFIKQLAELLGSEMNFSFVKRL